LRSLFGEAGNSAWNKGRSKGSLVMGNNLLIGAAGGDQRVKANNIRKRLSVSGLRENYGYKGRGRRTRLKIEEEGT